MHKGMMRAFRNTAYMNLDTGEITKKKSVARGWEEDGYDVDEVVCTKSGGSVLTGRYERYWEDGKFYPVYEDYEMDSFRTVKA